MNKGAISKVLSLSCVENYFLGYFQDKFDLRALYVESYVSFNEVIDSFVNGEVSYENYPLKRLQDLSETLGYTSHSLQKEVRFDADSLNLIRVNKQFFNHSKLLPWRADHFIAIEKKGGEYTYLNNYPLSDGILSVEKLEKVYDGACLVYRHENKFDKGIYIKLCESQYLRIINENIKDFKVTEKNLIRLRDALLVLKTLRKRSVEWLKFEEEERRFDVVLSFQLQSQKLIKYYDNLLVTMQLQIARKQIDIDVVNQKLIQLCEQERNWNKMVKVRKDKLG